jgi:hypothetical protein
VLDTVVSINGVELSGISHANAQTMMTKDDLLSLSITITRPNNQGASHGHATTSSSSSTAAASSTAASSSTSVSSTTVSTAGAFTTVSSTTSQRYRDTKLCPKWQRGACPFKDSKHCFFAHGSHELRQLPSWPTGTASLAKRTKGNEGNTLINGSRALFNVADWPCLHVPTLPPPPTVWAWNKGKTRVDEVVGNRQGLVGDPARDRRSAEELSVFVDFSNIALGAQVCSNRLKSCIISH